MAGRKKADKKITVFVGRIGEEPKLLLLEAGATVGDALKEIGYNGDAKDVRVDGRPADHKQKLVLNDVISIIVKVQGG